MKEHLLLEKAFIYPLEKKQPELVGCSFDSKNGFWIINQTGEPYITDKAMSSPPRSKKCDVETGEDQKGE